MGLLELEWVLVGRPPAAHGSSWAECAGGIPGDDQDSQQQQEQQECQQQQWW